MVPKGRPRIGLSTHDPNLPCRCYPKKALNESEPLPLPAPDTPVSLTNSRSQESPGRETRGIPLCPGDFPPLKHRSWLASDPETSPRSPRITRRTSCGCLFPLPPAPPLLLLLPPSPSPSVPVGPPSACAASPKPAKASPPRPRRPAERPRAPHPARISACPGPQGGAPDAAVAAGARHRGARDRVEVARPKRRDVPRPQEGQA
jgi:hypothetical protein